MDVSVMKRDGISEPFNIDKLITSIAKAGVPLAQSEQVASDIKNWIEEKAVNGVISSNQVRDKIIEMLATEYPAEADSYKAFKK